MVKGGLAIQEENLSKGWRKRGKDSGRDTEILATVGQYCTTPQGLQEVEKGEEGQDSVDSFQRSKATL